MTAAPSSLKTTPLHGMHRELNARMVDFGGWEMPLHYGSQLAEHHAVRRDCGIFDVSHMLALDVRGDGSRPLLSYMLANNIARLDRVGKALYTCMLNPEGGILDDLIVYRRDDDSFRLIVNAGTADKDYAWLTHQRDRVAPGVEVVARRDLAIIAVQGPGARERVYQALPEARAKAEGLPHFSAAQAGDAMLARTGYTGEDGFEIVLPAPQAAPLWQRMLELGATPAGLGARDTLRLEAGMNLYGQDMDESTTPLETGLTWTVDLQAPRDFVGKGALLNAHPTRHAVGLVLRDRGVMRSHQRVVAGPGAGEVTSGGFGPTVGVSIGLARVPLGVRPGDAVQVEVRGQPLAARVVKPPFVRRGQVLVQ